MSGLIHIYTGEGKGKTTAATGLAVRAAGRGKRVLFMQFLKDNSSGELVSLRRLGVSVRGLSKPYGFVSAMSAEEKCQVLAEHNALLQQAIDENCAGSWEVVILDEIMAAYQLQMVNPELIEQFLSAKPEDLELVLTGRDAPQSWIALADYVTEMVMYKHPFQQGITAREGIEY